MKPRGSNHLFTSKSLRGAITLWCAASFAMSLSVTFGQDGTVPASTPTTQAIPKIPNDQLDSLVSPIALYPDELLSQTLVASTYPLEVIQLQQWMDRNKTLKGKALADAVQKQPWDPSIQSMVAVPDVVQRLAGNIQWTTELGNAFLAQQVDVMAAVQRMRVKAQGSGNLKSGEQIKVETQTVDSNQQVIVIQQTNPEVIYVPSYDPVVVYGAPAYPYPSYIYPGYVPGTGLAFGAGLILGAAWGGGWGYHCGWGGDCHVNINHNNTYVNHYNNVNHINRGQNGGQWQHQPAHRGGAPYGPGGIGGAGRPGGVGGIGGAGKPGGPGGVGGIGGAGKPGGPGGVGGIGGGGNRPSTLPANSGSGRNNIGGRSTSPGSGYGASNNAFGGGFGGGGAARASSSRGSSSMAGSRGGGSRGGRGGSRGGRGGGGGRR